MRSALPFLAAILLAPLAHAGCRHTIQIPGGDIRIGHETHPTGPLITRESQSGAPCGPGLPSCPGTIQCFAEGGKATCMTEDAACTAAACGQRPCEILESFPLRAVCR